MFRSMIKMTKITILNPNGEKYETEGQIQNDKIYIYDQKAVIDTGFIISYTLSNGLHKTSKVINSGYYGDVQSGSGFPVYQCTIRDTNLEQENNKSSISIGTLNNYGNNQIGNNNSQKIEIAFKDLINQIESAKATPEEKKEAKNLLKTFLEHPLVNTLLGSSLGIIASLL